ncbi:MAG: tRNA lysidine(34) synthetase TilS, partial [Candidatus Eisenbacteria bacterium]|nr:tRNA lysidine(34) synthetase TilS [Candidatus Eisenbacteria bacterium]
LCERLGLRCTSARWDTRARMRRRGLSGQRGLRVLRREFLSTVARRVAADRIATGHTADDQLETLLMRLGRGTGLTGAAGIDARRARWIRPLLAATRAEIEADLRGAGIEWREDSSNLSPDYLRNRIRHGAIPALLEALGGADGPRARADVARSAAQLMSEVGQVSRWLKARAHRIEQPLAVAGLESVKLDVSGLIRLPSFILRRVLARTWRRFSNEPLARPHLVMLERLARSTRRCGPLALPGGASASCTRGVLSITAFASSGPILRKQRFMSYICRSHPLSDGAISPQRRTRRAPGP